MSFSQLKVLYEDNHFIAVHKPAGWLAQGDKTNNTPLSEFVKQYIKVRYNKPGDVFLGIVHRLDRPVSGVTIFARTSKGLTRLNELFRERGVKKTYYAIVSTRPSPLEGHLEHYLLKDTERNITHAYNRQRTKQAKKAVLDYQLISSIANHHLVKVEPLTGRPHQIRVQLGRLGSPIRGDLKYGSNEKNRDGRIHLHSYRLEFIHPITKKPTTITGLPPNEQLWNTFKDFITY
jgi:23S rRNA pseudouridine1911/1915/1917 synthase